MTEQDLILPKKKSSKVGKAVKEILSKDQAPTEVGDIISNYAPSYVKEVEEAVKRGFSEHKIPFYVVVMHKKEAWAMNVMRNWFLTRQSKPSAKNMWALFPNHMHTVYEYDGKDLKILWSLPSQQEAAVILKNFALYHQDLVRWVRDALDGKLE